MCTNNCNGRWKDVGTLEEEWVFFLGLLIGKRRLQFAAAADEPLSRVCLFVIPWTAACQASLSFTISQRLLKLMSIESVMPSNHLILCCPLLLLPSIFTSIRVFSSGLAFCMRWPKYWSFSFSISLSNEYSGLISCRIDWFDLLAVQGTLKSLLQHHSSKTSKVSFTSLYSPTLPIRVIFKLLTAAPSKQCILWYASLPIHICVCRHKHTSI